MRKLQSCMATNPRAVVTRPVAAPGSPAASLWSVTMASTLSTPTAIMGRLEAAGGDEAQRPADAVASHDPVQHDRGADAGQGAGELQERADQHTGVAAPVQT